jgi:UDP-N-acetylglucosamine 4,6-dehydratase
MFYTPVDFIRNALGEVGVTVDQGFAYCSGTNPHFLSVEELRAIDQPEVDQKACAFHA